MLRGDLVFALLVSVGCSRAPAPPSPTASASVSREPALTSAAATLDRMDTRRPLPLLPMMANHQKQNMRDHLLAIQDIITALAQDDFEEIERAARRIGFSEAMGQMCTHMGAGAEGFTEQALAFHHTADRVSVAARERDRARVLTELSSTLKTCTGCHAAWKQQVVDELTWQKVTSTVPPSHPHSP